MKQVRLMVTLGALTSAVVILFVSLSSASVSIGQSSDSIAHTQKQFYVSGDILPDHVGYPVLMALDRLRLESVAPVEQVYLKTAYANRRLQYADALLEKEKKQLAVSAITKAQKYLLSAANQVIDFDMPDAVAKHVIGTLEYHIVESERLAEEFNGPDKAVIDGLNEECSVMIERLRSRL